MDEAARARGLKKMHELLGEEMTQNALAYMGEFDQGFADLILEVAFGTVWSRPGLPTQTRSMITIAALTALGRAAELNGHIRGALRVGVKPEEIKEIIIHLSQYAGIPASVEAMHIFKEVTKAGHGEAAKSMK